MQNSQMLNTTASCINRSPCLRRPRLRRDLQQDKAARTGCKCRWEWHEWGQCPIQMAKTMWCAWRVWEPGLLALVTADGPGGLNGVHFG